MALIELELNFFNFIQLCPFHYQRVQMIQITVANQRTMIVGTGKSSHCLKMTIFVLWRHALWGSTLQKTSRRPKIYLDCWVQILMRSFSKRRCTPRHRHTATKFSTAYKTVFTEYYILNGMELIGTVGGTLGLMIGFSFMGSIISITDWIITLYCKVKISKKEAFMKRQERTKVAPRRASV